MGYLWLKWVGQLWNGKVSYLGGEGGGGGGGGGEENMKILIFRGVPFPVMAHNIFMVRFHDEG